MVRKGFTPARRSSIDSGKPRSTSHVTRDTQTAESSWVKTLFIEPGSPWENGYIEPWNCRLRDELLNRETFYTLIQAKVLTEQWRKGYNLVYPHGSELSDRACASGEEGDKGLRMGKETRARILSGVRVLDITDVVTGPLCTRYLADCGCEVIAIERPSGKAARELPYTHNGLSVEYITNHCGKKSIAIDLKAKGARELVLELAKVCDVVVENFRPGVMTRFGLDYDSLKKANPSIIMCSITGYGQKGPYAKEMALDVIIQACRGIAYMMGESGERPRFVSFAVTDILGALNAFGAICASLYRRSVTGEGEYIDIALADCAVAVLGNQVETHIFSGGKEEFRYMAGSFSGAVAPAGAFKGRDGYVAMFLITDEEWKRLAECMGRPELAVEPRFKTVGGRVKHREELAKILDAWLQEFEQVKDAVALLQDHGLVARPILSLAQALDEEQQIKDRKMLVNIEHPTLGTMTCVNTPFCFSNNRAGIEEPPPVAVGEHSEHILREILSLGDGEIKKLRESGVVFGPDGQSAVSK